MAFCQVPLVTPNGEVCVIADVLFAEFRFDLVRVSGVVGGFDAEDTVG